MTVERLARPRLLATSSVLGQVLLATVAVILALGMVYYYYGVLNPMRERRSYVANVAPGNWSDLYPAWLGARELLAHRRNPYGPEITREIQRGFYGRPIDPNRHNEPTNLEAFAYPVYVVFLLAPSLPFSFDAVQRFFGPVMLLLTAASIPLWMRALHLRLPSGTGWLAWVATLSSYTVVDGLHLQQITLLVAILMAGSTVALAGGQLFVAGVLLALATVKPQLTILIVALFLFWTLAEWRSRQWFAIGFAGCMAAMLLGSELLLPGWFRFWLRALHQYVGYNEPSVLVNVLGKPIAMLVGAVAVLVCGWMFWRFRKAPVGSCEFSFSLVTALVVTQLFLPNAGKAYYNQVLLLPAALWLFIPGSSLATKSVLARLTWLTTIGLLALEWLSTLPPDFATLVLHRTFDRETIAIVVGPQLTSFFFPLALALFVLSVAPQVLRGAEASAS